MSKNRSFTFTQNNYPDTSLADTIDCTYIIYGKEVSESGTPHLQGFITFPNPRTLSGVIKSLPGCHVEVARTLTKAIEYCKKHGNYTERGKPPIEPKDKGALEKQRWKRILEAAESGNDTWLREEEPQIYLLHDKALERAHKKAKMRPQTLEGETQHKWYYGPPGTGKSHKARVDNPDAYIKDPKSIWWDGYNNEDVVIIDDFDKYQVSQGGDMKRWMDKYPFQAQHKGGSQLIRPKEIIVTSNYHPKEIWEDETTRTAILRRLNLTHFPDTSPFNYGPSSGLHPSFVHPRTHEPKEEDAKPS